MLIKKFKDGSEAELKDTTNIQLQSLINFAEKIKYRYRADLGLFANTFGGIERTTVSVETMQTWHNSNFKRLLVNYPWHGEPYYTEVEDTLQLTKGYSQPEIAIKSKLVNKTKLQWSKKQRKLITVDHQIEFI